MNQSKYLPRLTRVLFPVMGISLLSIVTFAGSVMDTEERILELDNVINLKASAVEADILVKTHEANTGRLMIHRTVKDLSDEEAATVMDHIKTRYEVEDDTLVLESIHPDNAKEWKKATGIRKVKFNIRYELWIPASLDVFLKTVEGDLVVENVSGQCKLATVDGDILIRNGGKSIVANTVDGDIQIQSARGMVKANTVDGDIIAVGTSSIMANATDGDILVEFTGQPEGNNQINTIDGDLQVALAEDVAVSLVATTQGGEIDSELPITKSTGWRGNLVGDLNGGGSKLLLNTIDGDISITKAKKKE